MSSVLTDSHQEIARMADFELGDFGFEAGESRLGYGTPIVIRKGVGECTRVMENHDATEETQMPLVNSQMPVASSHMPVASSQMAMKNNQLSPANLHGPLARIL